jgi:outer membrane protein TolC
VLATRQILTLARDRESELAMQAEKARADLARWIGAAADGEPADSPPDILTAMPPPLSELQQRIDVHPSHAATAGGLAVAAADLALAREATRPDKSIEIGYGRRASRFGDMVSIQFAMDLPLFPKARQDRGIAASLARLERADALQEDHLRMLRAEVAAVYAEWQFGRERLARIDRELLPDAQARVNAALAAYRSGHGELAGVLEARRAEIEARLTRIQLVTQTARARLQLAYFEDLGDSHERQH